MTYASFTIEVPGVPIGKGRPRFVRKTGHAFTPERTRSYESVLRDAAALAFKGEPLDGPLAVTVKATFPIPQSWSMRKRDAALIGVIRPTSKPDADNLLKVLDALNEIVGRDDKQIVEATILKRYGVRPGLKIVVTPLAAVAEARAA